MKATRLPSGNYRCRVEIGRDSSGKRIWKSFTGPNRKAVEAEAAQFALHSRTATGSTVGKALDTYIDDRSATISASTVRGYRGIARRMNARFPAIMNMSVNAVTTADLQRIVDTLSRDKSTKTIMNEVACLYSALRHAGVVIDMPNYPQRVKPVYRIPSEEVVSAVIAASHGSALEIPILLAAYGPLRRGEICALTLDDIDGNIIHVQHDIVKDEHGKWVIKPPKTVGSDRYIEMLPEVIELIREQGYVTRMNPDTLTRRFEEFLQTNGFKKFRFHDLRHWCCSYLHGIGVPDRIIMDRSGHSDYNTLKRIYTHSLQGQSKAETERILNAFRVTSRVTTAPQNRPFDGQSCPSDRQP